MEAESNDKNETLLNGMEMIVRAYYVDDIPTLGCSAKKEEVLIRVESRLAELEAKIAEKKAKAKEAKGEEE